MRYLRCLLALALALLVSVASAQKFAAIPPLTSPVTDTAGMLSAPQRAALENVLKEYKTRTGSQVAVLLVTSTEPEAIEQYGIRVADAWKIGRKGVDDGAILIVAKDNPKSLRRLRIEAGYGVEGALTDAQSKRILEDVIAPHFRQNDFYGGLVAGVSAITALLDKEHFPAAAKQPVTENGSVLSVLIPFLLFGVLIVVSALSRSGRSRRAFGNDDWGQAAGVILGSAIGHALGGRSGGGFGDGGGFSGGGGGFGGGGASGDW